MPCAWLRLAMPSVRFALLGFGFLALPRACRWNGWSSCCSYCYTPLSSGSLHCKTQHNPSHERPFRTAGKGACRVKGLHWLDIVGSGQVSATEANERSSRSHTVLRLTLDGGPHEGSSIIDGGVDLPAPRTVSHMDLIDLAGSESARVGPVIPSR